MDSHPFHIHEVPPKASDPTALAETWVLPYAATLCSSVRAKGIFLEVRARL